MLSAPSLIERARAGPFLARELLHRVVVVHLAFLQFLLGHRHLVVIIEVAAIRRHPLEPPAHALLKGFDLSRGARETTTSLTSRAARCTTLPSIWSEMNEQLGQPSSHPGPNMKWYTISWLLPSKRSASVSLPFWPSNTYSFSTLSHGSSRRCRLSSLRSRVNSFSLPNSSFRAASHSACDTTFGPSILLFAVPMTISPLFSFL